MAIKKRKHSYHQAYAYLFAYYPVDGTLCFIASFVTSSTVVIVIQTRSTHVQLLRSTNNELDDVIVMVPGCPYTWMQMIECKRYY